MRLEPVDLLVPLVAHVVPLGDHRAVELRGGGGAADDDAGEVGMAGALDRGRVGAGDRVAGGLPADQVLLLDVARLRQVHVGGQERVAVRGIADRRSVRDRAGDGRGRDRRPGRGRRARRLAVRAGRDGGGRRGQSRRSGQGCEQRCGATWAPPVRTCGQFFPPDRLRTEPIIRGWLHVSSASAQAHGCSIDMPADGAAHRSSRVYVSTDQGGTRCRTDARRSSSRLRSRPRWRGRRRPPPRGDAAESAGGRLHRRSDRRSSSRRCKGPASTTPTSWPRRARTGTAKVEVTITGVQARDLAGQGVKLRLKRSRADVAQRAASAAGDGVPPLQRRGQHPRGAAPARRGQPAHRAGRRRSGTASRASRSPPCG